MLNVGYNTSGSYWASVSHRLFLEFDDCDKTNVIKQAKNVISLCFLTLVVRREWPEGLKAICGGHSGGAQGAFVQNQWCAITPHLILPDGPSSERRRHLASPR